MHHELHTEIEIAAPAEVVWGILTDLDRYPEWNPFIVSSEGTAAVGEKLVNRMEPPGGRAMDFRPTVTEVEPNAVFEWLGRLGLPRIFDGRHRFELEAGPTGTRFVQSEQLDGLLVRPLRKSLDTHTLAGFEALNAALKDRAEAEAGPSA